MNMEIKPGRMLMRRSLFIGMICILAFSGGCTLLDGSGSQGITCEKYERLEMDMSYLEVVEIMGSEGRNIENLPAGTGHEVSVYSWRDPHGANVTCRFFDSRRLVSKEEEGLDCPED